MLTEGRPPGQRPSLSHAAIRQKKSRQEATTFYQPVYNRSNVLEHACWRVEHPKYREEATSFLLREWQEFAWFTNGPSTVLVCSKRRRSTGQISSGVGMPAPSRTVMQTSCRVASQLVLAYSPTVHLKLPSLYQLKKHQRWPFSTERHMLPHPLKAWSLGEWGMPNCFNRRFHLIWHWFLLVVTRSLSTLWCSNDLLALNSSCVSREEIVLVCFPGGPLLTTLVHSQLHQRHLMQTTWFDGALLRVRKQTANIQPFFQSHPMPKSFFGVKVHWQHSLSLEPPLLEPFSVVKIDRTALLFPLVTSYARQPRHWCYRQWSYWPCQEWWCFWETGPMTTLAGTLKWKSASRPNGLAILRLTLVQP